MCMSLQENYEKLTLPTTDIEQTTTESNIPKQLQLKSPRKLKKITRNQILQIYQFVKNSQKAYITMTWKVMYQKNAK